MKSFWLVVLTLGVAVGFSLAACDGGSGGGDETPDSAGPEDGGGNLPGDVRGDLATVDTSPGDNGPEPDTTPADVPPCTPDCEDKVCGDDDGCGGLCIVDEGCLGKPPCSIGFCDASGVCALQPQDGDCDDGNPCTLGDHCSQGACKPGTEFLDCEDGNPCTDDGCDPASGCTTSNNTLPCDDGDPCTVGDVCSAGDCVSGDPNTCDDFNDCTDDWCDQAEGCQHDPIPGAFACDDGNACTIGDACSNGVCQPGVAANCDDGDPCTEDSCDIADGCLWLPVPNGSACDDGDPCTVADFCQNGSCLSGGQKDCEDLNDCTADSCGPGGNCVHEPLTGDYYCSDDDPCTEPDWCENGVCQPGPPVPGCN